MEHPKAKGDRTTLAVMLALHEAGYAFSVPFSENVRFDLVLIEPDRLARVQCKTGRLRNGAVIFAMCSFSAHHRRPVLIRDYLDDVEYFAVYCRETSGVYLIPVGEIPLRRLGTLRVDPPRNCQRKRIRLAEDYEIGRVSVNASSAPRASAGA